MGTRGRGGCALQDDPDVHRDGKCAERPAPDVECERDQHDPGIGVDEMALPGQVDVCRGRLAGGDAFNQGEERPDLIPLFAAGRLDCAALEAGKARSAATNTA